MLMTRKYEGRTFLKPSAIRTCTVGAVVLIVVVGLVFGGGWGTVSSMGFEGIAALCPLGAFESLLGTWSFVPRMLLVLAVVLVGALLVGRAFCSWVCPVPPLARFLSTKRLRARDAAARKNAGRCALEAYEAGERTPTKPKLDSRHIMLCGALGSAAIFGFPVFCLVCPVGLTFGLIIAFGRLVGFNEPSWGLLVFPLILVLELTVLRSFCGRFCPIGALLSLLGRFSSTFKPQVDRSKCRRASKGEPCAVCASTCPEGIDPNADVGLVSSAECTRCNRCAEACPEGAIAFPLVARKTSGKADPMEKSR